MGSPQDSRHYSQVRRTCLHITQDFGQYQIMIAEETTSIPQTVCMGPEAPKSLAGKVKYAVNITHARSILQIKEVLTL